ncbi:8-amino-7-oxononanoate synthase [Porphyromonas sp. COT-290 OH3588]|uniref:8-amino-7-oxononanoate synthase n=1 Tax=Porphyromonas sp. COT-290 OH3588 TaxID=1515617 RepID=UPI00052CCF12|nr:8-amino-7-oxononanoate synthase [Porphyromonas sp. COT-290 OH3588]KGO01585.1 8-amino-7-oxononanoate synthase [Porphyromonas sp. COT-290 OH3588]
MDRKYQAELEGLAQSDMLRSLKTTRAEGTYIYMDGRRMLNLSSNDYLGIATRGDLAQEVEAELHRLGGAGSTSSRLMTGNYEEYQRLEDLLAERFAREAALVFGSGYHMNVGIVPALADSSTIILADRLVHASMIDGIRLSGCRFERFRHNDLAHLERLLNKYTGAERIIVMVESVYSMDGDCADLKGLVALKERYPSVMLYVDEAHAIGVFGDTGLGLAEATGTIQQIDLLLGTFGKALAGMGGYLICSDVVKRYLVNRCRSLIFSTALPPLTIAYDRLAFEALPRYTAERQRLKASSEHLRQRLGEWSLQTPSQTHIIPIVIGGAQQTVQLAERLQALGYYALAVRPPTVPEGSCRLRLSLTAEIDLADFERDFAPLVAELVATQHQ